MFTVKWNCFAKGDFGIKKTISAQVDDKDDRGWIVLQEQVDCLSDFNILNDFINMDNLAPIIGYQMEESMVGWRRGGDGARKRSHSTP
jgi:hypothetical protein